MKSILCIALITVLVSLTPQTSKAEQLLYLASTSDKSIVTYAIDNTSGKLTRRFDVKLPGNAGPLTFSPDKQHVYAAVTGLDNGKAGVCTLKRAPDGSLELLATANIAGRSPYIRTDPLGRFLLAAHYGTGDVTVYRITNNLCTDELLDHQHTERTAHCIELDPSGRFAFVPHTAPNKVYQFRLDATNGKLIPNQPAFAAGPDSGHQYHEPRHYAHHPTLDIGYTSNENGGGITAWKFDRASGTLSQLQTLCTLPPDYDGRSAAADIKITPDGRFAYVSNRDVTERAAGEAKQDTLTGVSLDPQTGHMKVIGHFPTAHFPRSFCIDLSGQFLYAAGQRSDTLVAYRIAPETGQLRIVETYETGGAPIWVMTAHTGADAGWTKHTVHSGEQSLTAIAADFTGDGRPDIMSNSKNQTRLFVNPDWREYVLDDNPQHNFIHSEVIDVDGDGDDDYIGARYSPGLIVWFEQPENPLTERWRIRKVDDQVNGIHGLIRGDVDLDGRSDLLATSAQPKPPLPDSLAWLRIPSKPHGVVGWERYIFADGDAPGLTHYLGFGDVNGDGRPDAATGAKGGPSALPGSGDYFAWWQAPADPTQVWTKHLIAGNQPGATNIHPADVDGDGQTDFIASRGHGRGIVWFQAPEWTERPIHGTIQEPHCLVATDMDADGDVDAATCAFGDKIAAWFENDGQGNFSTHIVGRNQEAYDIRAVDLDLDGDLDLLIAGRGSKNVVWYENPAKSP